MSFDGPLTEDERSSDLPVGTTVGNELGDLRRAPSERSGAHPMPKPPLKFRGPVGKTLSSGLDENVVGPLELFQSLRPVPVLGQYGARHQQRTRRQKNAPAGVT
jgi:hypothetical protein